MKKLKLLSFLIIPAIAIPAALNLTSCSLYTANVRVLNSGDYIADGSADPSKTYNDEKGAGVSLHSLLWGTKSFHHGNYILFISHTSNQESTNFLLGQPKFGVDDQDEYPLTNTKVNLPAGIDEFNTIDELKALDIGIVSYMLVDKNATDKIYGGGTTSHPDYEPKDPISPFAKWGAEDERLHKDHKKDDFVCKDGAAERYRDVISTISTIYKLTDAKDFVAIQAVKGKIIEDSGSIKTTTDAFLSTNLFANWVDSNWNIGKDLK